MKKYLNFLLAASALSILAGCVMEPPKPKMTSLEVQAIQSRSFDADKKATFNSVMSTLQDLGYIISSASYETGFITAESPTQKVGNQFKVWGILVQEVKPDEKTLVSASFDEIGPKNTRVRLNFVTKVIGNTSGGQVVNDTPILDPQIYNNAFSKIGDAIFIRQSQTSPSKSSK